MALIKCPECGKEISDKAGKCPNCGFPLDNVYNKADQPMPSTINNNVPLSKTKILIISAFVILIIASIGGYYYNNSLWNKYFDVTKSTDANFRTTYDISNKTNKNFESITIIWSVDMAGTTIEIPQKVRTGLSAHETINIQYSKSNAEDYVTNNLNRSYVSDLVFGIDLKKIKWELK